MNQAVKEFWEGRAKRLVGNNGDLGMWQSTSLTATETDASQRRDLELGALGGGTQSYTEYPRPKLTGYWMRNWSAYDSFIETFQESVCHRFHAKIFGFGKTECDRRRPQ